MKLFLALFFPLILLKIRWFYWKKLISSDLPSRSESGQNFKKTQEVNQKYIRMPLNKIEGIQMITVDLKKEHKLFNESEADGGINYQGHGVAFLKNDLSEKLAYCEDLDREEVQEFFNQPDTYYFGACTLEWEFKQGATLGRGKQAMWFAKYFKSGYFEEPFE